MNQISPNFGIPTPTPAEVVEAFIAALNTAEGLRRAAREYAALMEHQDGRLDPEEVKILEEMLFDMDRAESAVIDWGRRLNADGLLQRFAEFLTIETAGRI